MKPYVAAWKRQMADTETRRRAAIAQSETIAGVTPKG